MKEERERDRLTSGVVTRRRRFTSRESLIGTMIGTFLSAGGEGRGKEARVLYPEYRRNDARFDAFNNTRLNFRLALTAG